MSAFITSDLHLGHAKMLDFVRPDGEPLRPFSSIEEMHETLIERWNKKIHEKDRIYILGDVAIPRSGLQLLNRFNGKKILIKGNHDIYKIQDYLPYFEDIRGAFFRGGDSTMPGGLIFTHIPVHPSNLQGHYLGNVHGHLHCHLVLTDNGEVDRRYFNACLERNDFEPVALEDIKAYFKANHGRASDVQHSSALTLERAHS